MAYDEDFKQKVRKHYECNWDEISTVADKYGVARRTLAYWVKEYGWERGKYLKGQRLKKLEQELRGSGAGSAALEESKEKLKEELKKELQIEQGNSVIGSLIHEDLIGEISSDLMFKAMTQEYISEDMTKTVMIAKGVFHNLVSREPDNPDNIRHASAIVNMLKELKQTLYGKDPDTVVQIANVNNMGKEEMANLSDEELQRLIELERKKEE